MQTSQISCPCCSGLSFESCCQPYLSGNALPQTPLALMRSRYTAYVRVVPEYLVETTHPKTRHLHCKKDIEQWAKNSHWIKLEIAKSQANYVHFTATYLDANLQVQQHFEKSEFKRENNKWYYLRALD